MTATQTLEPTSHTSPVRLVDADVHPLPQAQQEMREYLEEPWRSMPAQTFSDLASVLYYPPGGGLRSDAVGTQGQRPGSDPRMTEQQLLRGAGVDYAILIAQVRAYSNPDLESALCTAANAWLADTWLTAYNRHDRYRGSICVCSGRPDLAAQEIERWAGHPGFVQVRVNAYAAAPYGNVRYDPIHEAASRHGLPVAMHFSKGDGLSLATPVGFGTTFFEQHSLYALTYASHLVSLVLEGAFDRFPGLRFVFVEGGFSWLLPLLRRLDGQWEALGGRPPATPRRPSEYIRDHVRFTSQPIEEPDERRDLMRVMEAVEAQHILMFSSDYPHWDHDDPRVALTRVPRTMREAVSWQTALDLYGLPAHRRDLDASDHRD